MEVSLVESEEVALGQGGDVFDVVVDLNFLSAWVPCKIASG